MCSCVLHTNQLIFDQRAQNLHWSRDTVFYKWCWENQIFIPRGLNLDFHLLQCTKVNSKHIKDPNTRHQTQELLKDLGMDRFLRSDLKSKNRQMEFHQVKVVRGRNLNMLKTTATSHIQLASGYTAANFLSTCT